MIGKARLLIERTLRGKELQAFRGAIRHALMNQIWRVKALLQTNAIQHSPIAHRQSFQSTFEADVYGKTLRVAACAIRFLASSDVRYL
jgi:hypothetical protein